MSAATIIFISIIYLLLLFSIAWFIDAQSAKGRNLTANPYIYALSLAVFCTAWTFYGSVGRAATGGVSFMTVYLGPTLTAPLWVLILRKIIVISKFQKITSVADFISSRYGKSSTLGMLATLIALFGVIPYISIQLKAVTFSFDILLDKNNESFVHTFDGSSLLKDMAFYVALVLAFFTIFFGTRHLDPNEKHEGLIAAIAFESIVKLIAFLAVGIFVTYGLYDGFGDLFGQAMQNDKIACLLTIDPANLNGGSWMALLILSMLAIFLLPRQFHVAVVENNRPEDVYKALWLFPLYLFIINIFVLPIAFGGLMQFSGQTVEADTFVLNLPLLYEKNLLALLVFIGGLSAATSMVIVSTIALSIMMSNNLIVPLLLRTQIIGKKDNEDISTQLLSTRRLCIVLVLLLSYAYFSAIGTGYTLVSIGMISFTAVAQFAPALLGGIYWKGGTKAGAFAGLITGFMVWAFLLPFPTMGNISWVAEILENGFLNINALRPTAFLGADNSDPIPLALFWSLFFNLTCYIGVSLFTTPSAIEHTQAALFVDIYKYTDTGGDFDLSKREAPLHEIKIILNRFLGGERATQLLNEYALSSNVNLDKTTIASPELISFAEKNLAGAIGAASARVIITSVAKEQPVSLEELMRVLTQTQEIMEYSRELEQKSKELEDTTHQLKIANEALKELDSLKNNFITNVTHELRTPITSIKSFSGILSQKKELPPKQKEEFLNIILSESNRITRLINQVLDIEKLQTNQIKWEFEELDMRDVLVDSISSVQAICKEKNILLKYKAPLNACPIIGDRDRLMQAVLNLLSNAAKFCPVENGMIEVKLIHQKEKILLSVWDNGRGISSEFLPHVFDRFTQDTSLAKPQGNGLGLYITKEIIERHKGNISVKSQVGKWTEFLVVL